MANWLVTGGTGLLGANAVAELSSSDSVVAVARSVPAAAGWRRADLSDPRQRLDLVGAVQADVVLHAAAISSIEASERDASLARELNVTASGDLAAQAARAGSAFVYISTDAVFDGSRGDYVEDDDPSPTSVYGKTKLDGEAAVLDAHPGALVARVNFYGWSPSGRRSLAEFFHSKLAAGQDPLGFDDITVSTLYVGALVDSIRALVRAGASGIVNVVSSEPTTKYQFGRRLATTFGFDPDRVVRTSSAEHLAIQRGTRLDLSAAKMEAMLGARSPDQQDGMNRLMSDEASGRRQLMASMRPG
jgi:dTDP-4-dehydrorhamnose reductase